MPQNTASTSVSLQRTTITKLNNGSNVSTLFTELERPKAFAAGRKTRASSIDIRHRSAVGNEQESKLESDILPPGPLGDSDSPSRPILNQYWEKFMSTNDLKKDIFRKIEKGGKYDRGFIYIFTSPKYPGYVKIGKTKQEPEHRVHSWARSCGITCNYVGDPNDKVFDFYSIVERLIDTELYNERRMFKCSRCKRKHRLGLISTDEIVYEEGDISNEKFTRGDYQGTKKGDAEGTEHGEWFEISEERALAVVAKWRKWIVEQKPYKKDGTLKLQWQRKCRRTSDSDKIVDWDSWLSSRWYEPILNASQSIDLDLGDIWPSLRIVSTSPPFLLVAIGLTIWLSSGKSALSLMCALAADLALFCLSLRYE